MYKNMIFKKCDFLSKDHKIKLQFLQFFKDHKIKLPRIAVKNKLKNDIQCFFKIYKILSIYNV